MDYSIESLPKAHEQVPAAWDQHYVASNWFEARWAKIDLWFALGRSGRRTTKTRIRRLERLA